MALTAIGRAALISREALKTRAYKDSEGVWTIGVGHTSAAGPPQVTPGLVITEAEALDIFARDLVQYEATVDRLVKVKLADHERDALVSFCYNVGGGNFAKGRFLKLLNSGDREAAGKALMGFSKPAAIITRRQAESDQFLTPYSVRLPKARSNDRSPVKVGPHAAPVPGRTGSGTSSVPRKPGSDRMAIPDGKWAEDTLAPFEVEAIQKRLRALGFYQVGKVDGKWGPSTKGALIALQATAGIEQDGHWGPNTKAALADDKNRRKVDPRRANTTAADLKAQGSAIVIQGDRITWTSVVGLVVAIAGAAYSAWQAPADLPFGSSVLLAFLPPAVAAVVNAIGPWLLAFIPLVYSILAARGIIAARVEAERTGLHNGEPDPAPSPPVTAAPDSRRAGGLLGQWFGRPATT